MKTTIKRSTKAKKTILRLLILTKSSLLIADCFAASEEVSIIETPSLETITVTASKSSNANLGSRLTDSNTLNTQRAVSSDSAHLFDDIPGVSLYGAGGVSSLPAIHGLADDRVRVQVNGMDLVAACPNHMNSALSYIDPSKVAYAKVYAGITPVSVGGDSIGGSIQVKSISPEFAEPDERIYRAAEFGTFYRSNGQAYGGNLSTTIASEALNFSYTGSSAQSKNYSAATNFKVAGAGAPGGEWLSGSTVGSTQYNSKNQEIDFAYRSQNHLFQITFGSQNVLFEGFPNQRMDMTANTSTQINALYTGKYSWGDLEARIYDQATRHAMNMGPDRFSYGTLGMPMETEAKTTGINIHGNILPNERDTIRLGIEYQKYTLYDWWPQAGGMMGPNTFWNVDFGQRDKVDSFAEWEEIWNARWLTQLGIRSNFVSANASPVQGYNTSPIWNADATTFNALSKQHTDYNWDLTAIAQYTPTTTQTFDFGFARKSHSPNLYQRFPWSTQPMATLMNNFVGDGNGYIGNVNLNPEIAHTLSTSGDWHDAEQEIWNIKGTAYYTYVQDYIDARRCDFGQCGGIQNLTSTQGFVNLQYINQNAELWGFDGSVRKILFSADGLGQFSSTGLLNYVRGHNLSSGDNLYNIMPLNTKWSISQQLEKWTNTVEMQWVDGKTNVSQVRNEIPTSAYSLVNWRTSYVWKEARLDIAIDNVLNRFYSQPLGGAYVGQGASMTSNGIPWGVVVPGMGRSVNIAFHYYY